MNTGEAKLSMNKLNSQNYQIWKYKMEMLLYKDDLWGILHETAPEPAVAEWEKRNRQAMATIALLVEDDHLVHIRKCKTAGEMWRALKELYERSNLNSKLYLLRKLYRLRLGNNQSMEGHINAMLEIVEELRALGEDLKENHVTAMLLCSIPESYGSLITALEARPEGELTLNYVKGKLIDEDKRRRENNEGYGEASETALKTGYIESRYRRDTRNCYNCGKPGHIRRECRNPRREPRPRFTETRASVANRHDDATQEKETERNTDREDHLCFNVTKEKDLNGWFIDSGATNHMTGDLNFFKNLQIYKQIEKVRIADGNSIDVAGIGSGSIFNNSPSETVNKINLENVLYVPKLEGNLLSVKKLTNLGYTVTFNETGCKIEKGHKIVTTQDKNKILYTLEFSARAMLIHQEEHIDCIHRWHRRLGHRDPQAIKQLEKENLTMDLRIKRCQTLVTCEECIKGKTTMKPFPKKSDHRSTEAYTLLHSDLCGPMKTATIGGKKYLMTITDDYSRYTESYLLEHKDQTNQFIMEYIMKWNNVFKRKPQILRTDRGGEYVNNILDKYLKQQGIQRQLTVPHTPQQNGVSERKNRTLLEMTRCMLNDAHLDNSYWGEAVITATYLQNRLPHKSCIRTPYELWHGNKPYVNHLRTFGSRAYVRIPNENLTKLDVRTKSGRMVGYSEESKGYRIRLDDTGKVVISRSVTFIENQNPTIDVQNKSDTDKIEKTETEIPTNETEVKLEVQNDTSEQSPQPRRSMRTNKGIPADKLTLKTIMDTNTEPQNWKEIMEMKTYEKEKWMRAIQEEMEAFNLNKAWDLVPRPKDKHVIGNRWTFKLKQDAEGNTIQYRARLVAKGYSQMPGIDYQETYAPVVKFSTMRILLTISSGKRMHTRHLDVKSAFLNGDIAEDIYMELPEGQIKTGQEMLVCKLRKSIYGLKQAANNWNSKINKIFIAKGFTRGIADQCLYIRKDNTSLTYILLYVDDLLVSSDDPKYITEITETLRGLFSIKDLGPVSYYLGIHIELTNEGKYHLRQTSKIKTLLKQYQLEEAKGSSTPMEVDFLRKTEKPNELGNLLIDHERYRQAVGALLHIGMVSRPDICAAVGFLGRKVAEPRQMDWNAAKMVLKYLKTTANDGLTLGGTNEMTLDGYVDADWAGDSQDRKSTSGYIFRLDGCVIDWSSRKQSCIAMSSTEAEYIAAATACQELIWLKQLLIDFGFKQTKPTTIYEDNQSCMKLVESNKYHTRTKHIDVKYHLLRHLHEQKEIQLKFCSTENMIADILTKPLGRLKHEVLMKKLPITTFIC